MITENEILTSVCKLAAESPINGLNGGIYKKVRPVDSKLEDFVVHIIPGFKGKFLQNGALYAKIFYQDLRQGETYYEDTINGQSKESLLHEFSKSLLNMNGFAFDISSRESYVQAVEEIHQHYAILKMNFEILHIEDTLTGNASTSLTYEESIREDRVALVASNDFQKVLFNRPYTSSNYLLDFSLHDAEGKPVIGYQKGVQENDGFYIQVDFNCEIEFRTKLL